jgi:hypothetical protein
MKMNSSFKEKFLKFSFILPIFLFFLIILQGIISQPSLNKNLQNPVIYYNGAIFTLEKDKTGKEIIQQALRTENGEITHIGTNEKILKLKNRKTTLFDLNGKSLFPAFVEKNLEKENSYLKVINIETIFPNKLIVHCAEREEFFSIKKNNSRMRVLSFTSFAGMASTEKTS